MANEYTVNSSDLIAVADTIRAKSGITTTLSFPYGFISAINSITSSGTLDYVDNITVDETVMTITSLTNTPTQTDDVLVIY